MERVRENNVPRLRTRLSIPFLALTLRFEGVIEIHSFRKSVEDDDDDEEDEREKEG